MEEQIKKMRLLLVDDEDNVRKALKRVFRKEPYEVEDASSAREGMEKLSEKPFDIIISDYKMPHINGLEFLKWVRDYYPDTIRIMLTGQADMDTAVRAINEGEIYRFFTKPWDDQDLRISIRIASEHLKLQRRNLELLDELNKTKNLLDQLEEKYPGISKVKRDEEGRIIIDE